MIRRAVDRIHGDGRKGWLPSLRHGGEVTVEGVAGVEGRGDGGGGRMGGRQLLPGGWEGRWQGGEFVGWMRSGLRGVGDAWGL